jgi:hypothetical protein
MDESIHTKVAFHHGRLMDAYKKFLAGFGDDIPEGVMIEEFTWEGGVQWYARVKGQSDLVLLYEYEFKDNPMEC